MTALTPIYGLEYIVEGEPLRDARPALENSMKKVEAALAAGGVAAAGASDVLAVSGRVSVLEADTGWVSMTLANGWAGGMMAYRVRGNVCWLSFNSTHASYTSGQAVITLPAAARPATSMFPTGSYLGVVIPLDVLSTGVITARNPTAAAGLTLLTSYPLG